MSVVRDLDTSLSKHENMIGVYRARVENNKDPLGIGRVQIRVPMLHGLEGEGVSSDSLPWASMCSNNGAGYNFGSFIVPEIGEYVFVVFEDGDTNKPVYLGSIFGTGSLTQKKYGSRDTSWSGVAGVCEVPNEAQREDPTNKVLYKSRLGSKIYMDTSISTEGTSIEDEYGQRFKINSAESGRSICMTGTGGVSVVIRDSHVYIGSGSTMITVDPNSKNVIVASGKGKITMDSSGNVKIDSAKTQILSPNVKVSAKNLKMRGADVHIVESAKSIANLVSAVGDIMKNGITPEGALEFLKTTPFGQDVMIDLQYYQNILGQSKNSAILNVLKNSEYSSLIATASDKAQEYSKALKQAAITASFEALSKVFKGSEITSLLNEGLSLYQAYQQLSEKAKNDASILINYGTSAVNGVSYDSKDIGYLLTQGYSVEDAKGILDRAKVKIAP